MGDCRPELSAMVENKLLESESEFDVKGFYKNGSYLIFTQLRGWQQQKEK